MATAPWQAVAALVDPVRRALFDHVRTQGHPVTREEAADAVGISRNLAAFHLDKLVDAGLLDSGYQTPDDEQPRGRGRTPKVYRPSEDGLDLSIPQRRYELIAAILVDAIAERPDDAEAAALRLARARGKRHGKQHALQQSRDPLARARKALAELGFEPVPSEPGTLLLRNCPFHALAVNQPELVCGLNHAFLKGLIRGMGADSLAALLAPRPGACCVEIRSEE